jgi:NTE family protein
MRRLAALPRPLAFVFPGGGALGSYQVGVLKALTAAGIEPDLLIGVSAGAVNASLFAWNSGLDGVAVMESIWRNLRRRDLLRLQPGRLAMAFAGWRPSFVDNRHGERFLRTHLSHRQLQDAPTRLAVVATSLTDGLAVALTHGDVATAVLASSAFPGVYPPIERDGVMLIDGGVVADIPLDIAVDLGAKSALIISVPLLAPSPPPRKAIDILFRASTFGVEAHGRTMMLRPPAGLEVIEIPAPPSPITTFAVGRSGAAIEQAYRETSAWLAATTD